MNETQGLYAQVQLGAEYLDKHYKTWYKRVNADTLDISNPCDCICGQLNIWDTKRHHKFVGAQGGDDAGHYGIIYSGKLNYDSGSAILTRAWCKEIAKRLHAQAQAHG